MIFSSRILSVSILNKTVGFIAGFFITFFSFAQDLEMPDGERQKDQLLKVFIDCDNCDMGFIRQELDYVSHVRDQSVAEVHIFITSIYTASGGRLFELSFTGKNSFSEVDNKFNYNTLTTATYDEIREGLKKNIELGLVPYLLHTGAGENISVNVEAKDFSESDEMKKDPWRNWLFDTYGHLGLTKEQSVENLRIYTRFEAERVTEEWRISFNYSLRDNRRSIYKLDDNSGNFTKDTTYIRFMNSFNGRGVKSLGEHWSVGSSGNYYSDTYLNLKSSYSIGPALEFSIFPYTQSLKRELTFAYRVRYVWHNYISLSKLGFYDYSYPFHSLYFNVRYRQPWGNVTSRVSASNHLNNFEYKRLEFSNWLSVRVFKGLSVSLNAHFTYKQDQIYLPAEKITETDILAGTKSLPSTFDVEISGGLNYKFGSIYNNIVNTRL